MSLAQIIQFLECAIEASKRIQLLTSRMAKSAAGVSGRLAEERDEKIAARNAAFQELCKIHRENKTLLPKLSEVQTLMESGSVPVERLEAIKLEAEAARARAAVAAATPTD